MLTVVRSAEHSKYLCIYSLPSAAGTAVVMTHTYTGTSSEVNEARGGLILAAGRVRSKKKKVGKRKNEKICPTENTPRNPQQPSDRDHLDTAREKPRPTRSPILARFDRSRVCGNRPRTALAISKNDECYTH